MSAPLYARGAGSSGARGARRAIRTASDAAPRNAGPDASTRRSTLERSGPPIARTRVSRPDRLSRAGQAVGRLVSIALGAATLGSVFVLALSCGDGESTKREPPAAGSAALAPLSGHDPRRLGAVLVPSEREEYTRELLDSRKTRDEFFRSSPDSPVPLERRAVFPPLEYYAVDPSWRFVVTASFDASPRRLTTLTSTGEERPVMRVGSVTFERRGQRASLQLYRTFDHPAGDSSLWIPFIDAGAGSETYPAGRYLDVEPRSDGTLVLDFNLAYNPYCAYGLDYSCPVTPRENHLSFAVTAGEKGFHR